MPFPDSSSALDEFQSAKKNSLTSVFEAVLSETIFGPFPNNQGLQHGHAGNEEQEERVEGRAQPAQVFPA